ncbi:MAG: RES family NAD+ phosphorylase, partial [Mangrovibacterium sp.]|nr:RES family NAD+ phosphorylase [Mangrovibacterium sp.]
IVYRITKKEHSALDRVGGLYGLGRWHKKGNLVIYTSEHASLAAWEKIVHVTSFENLPENLLLVKIELPDGIEIQSVPEKVLVKGWNHFPFARETVDFGTSFLQKKEHLALKVPTVIIPDEFNIILNPLHPNIRDCKVVSTVPFVFDQRVSKEN